MNSIGRRRSRFGWWPLALLAAVLGVGYYLASPRIVSVHPPSGAAEQPADAPIVVTFNVPMDRDSVEQNLSIEPALEGSFEWEGRRMTFRPISAWPEGTAVTIRLRAGARSDYFLPLLRGKTWTFQSHLSRIAYLRPQSESAMVNWVSSNGSQGGQLTDSSPGVADFDLSFRSGRLIYIGNADNGQSASIITVDLESGEVRELHRCPPQIRCRHARLSPNGDWLAFEQLEAVETRAGATQAGASQVMLLDVVRSSAPRSLTGPSRNAGQPDWLPTGELTYYDPIRRAHIILSIAGSGMAEEAGSVPNELGEAGTWSPEGAFWVGPQVVFPNHGRSDFYSHLMRVEVATGLTTDLSAGAGPQVEDATPAYAPDGLRIGFARKWLDPERWTLGRQLWLMRSDGSQPRTLSDAPIYHHAGLAWSPDSRQLAFVRLNQADVSQPPEIWVISVETGEARMLVEGGYLPQWMP